MRIDWLVDSADVARVDAFMKVHGASPFVKKRAACNLAPSKEPVAIERFWEIMVGCLLTTQQRSGPNSAISRFLHKDAFTLTYLECFERPDLEEYVVRSLTSFGGIRRTNTIGREVAANRDYLREEGWEAVRSHLEAVRMNPSPANEREAATFIDDQFWGFGPKQSRNLLQWLGLSRYEIPIDSRISRWLNEFGFPVAVNAATLADREYYEFVSDGFQRLCEACDLMPCVLDAAIFASYDKGAWTDENV